MGGPSRSSDKTPTLYNGPWTEEHRAQDPLGPHGRRRPRVHHPPPHQGPRRGLQAPRPFGGQGRPHLCAEGHGHQEGPPRAVGQRGHLGQGHQERPAPSPRSPPPTSRVSRPLSSTPRRRKRGPPSSGVLGAHPPHRLGGVLKSGVSQVPSPSCCRPAEGRSLAALECTWFSHPK